MMPSSASRRVMSCFSGQGSRGGTDAERTARTGQRRTRHPLRRAAQAGRPVVAPAIQPTAIARERSGYSTSGTAVAPSADGRSLHDENSRRAQVFVRGFPARPTLPASPAAHSRKPHRSQRGGSAFERPGTTLRNGRIVGLKVRCCRSISTSRRRDGGGIHAPVFQHPRKQRRRRLVLTPVPYLSSRHHS